MYHLHYWMVLVLIIQSKCRDTKRERERERERERTMPEVYVIINRGCLACRRPTLVDRSPCFLRPVFRRTLFPKEGRSLDIHFLSFSSLECYLPSWPSYPSMLGLAELGLVGRCGTLRLSPLTNSTLGSGCWNHAQCCSIRKSDGDLTSYTHLSLIPGYHSFFLILTTGYIMIIMKAKYTYKCIYRKRWP